MTTWWCCSYTKWLCSICNLAHVAQTSPLYHTHTHIHTHAHFLDGLLLPTRSSLFRGRLCGLVLFWGWFFFFFFTGASADTQRNLILTRHHKTTWSSSVYRSTRVGFDPTLTDLAQPWNCIFTTDQLQIIVCPVIEDMFLQIRRLCVITSTHTHTPTPTYIYHGGRVYMVHNHTVVVTLYILTPSWEKHAMKKKVLYRIL